MQHRRTHTVISCLVAAAILAGCGEEQDDMQPTDSAKPKVAASSEEAPSAAPPSTQPPAAAPPAAPENGVSAFSITVVDGAVQGGLKPLRASKGDTVRLTVTSDEADEVHVHGVDKELDVAAGTASTMSFTVSDPGSYEIEMHDSGLVLGTLEVR